MVGEVEVPAPVSLFSSSYDAIACSCSLVCSNVRRLLSVLMSLIGNGTYCAAHSEERADIDDHCVNFAVLIEDDILDAADVAVLLVIDAGPRDFSMIDDRKRSVLARGSV